MTSRLVRWIKHDAPSTSSRQRVTYAQEVKRPENASFNPILRLKLPHDGVIFMNPTEEARIHAQMNRTEPAYDYVLTGSLEVEPPADCPRFKCHAIRIRFESRIKPDSPTSVVTEAILFERELKIAEDDENGIVIDSIQKFEFSLILPNTIPPRDWGEWGRISNELYGTLEGVDLISPMSSPASPTISQTSSSPLFSFGKKRPKVRDTPIPAPPANNGFSAIDTPWLEGKHSAMLPVRFVYNPDPAGGVHSLNEVSKGQAAQLGEYEIRLYSDVWTVASLLRVSIAIMDIPPPTTVFYVAVYLVQSTMVTFEKGGRQQQQTFDKRFLLMDKGQPVERRNLSPDASLPALWRGKEAQGYDDGELILELDGRVGENDYVARPSTLPNIVTPARTSHTIEVEVFFSSWGQDAHGRPLRISGPGGLRLMKIKKPVMLPNCSILPNIVRLPSYVDDENGLPPEEESSHLHLVCSCLLSMDEVQSRMRAALEKQSKMEVEDAERLVQMKDLERT